MFSPEHIGAHGFNRKELARWHLLERGGVKDKVHPRHRVFEALLAAHVSNVELDARIGPAASHVVLLLFVAGENADFGDIAVQVTAQDGVPKVPVPPVMSSVEQSRVAQPPGRRYAVDNQEYDGNARQNGARYYATSANAVNTASCAAKPANVLQRPAVAAII
jgi:hypothetical protein